MLLTLISVSSIAAFGCAAWKVADVFYTALQPNLCTWCGDLISNHDDQRPC